MVRRLTQTTLRRYRTPSAAPHLSALFNFQSLLTVLLLFICVCTYVHAYAPSWLDAHKKGFRGLFWKGARIGERLSAWVSLSLVAMGVYVLFWQK